MRASHSGHSSIGRFTIMSSGKKTVSNSRRPPEEKLRSRLSVSVMGADVTFFSIAHTPEEQRQQWQKKNGRSELAAGAV